jgi:hypothetical protein
MATAMMHGVQDVAILVLRNPWPLLASAELALPEGRTDGEHVFLWFGDAEGGEHIVLPAIPLLEISEG